MHPPNAITEEWQSRAVLRKVLCRLLVSIFSLSHFKMYNRRTLKSIEKGNIQVEEHPRATLTTRIHCSMLVSAKVRIHENVPLNIQDSTQEAHLKAALSH
ncbi:hypothetical protein FRB94_012847 [Tulasnella sp. JGI-2019a]|nr:hypothetical protein FRB94_012847 [Tulasnella sp. JGI-2019a]KAG9016382.1 hypothetical protein FRB93_010631 [Tulasnella sp. JGI-2019a]KAG9028407.1 hypothetical protein FRB95_006538 [Tulasnella sp. JGI-2019a]